MNDLWEYDFTYKWWKWLSGAKTPNQLAVYGTKGEASSSNQPGARYGHSMVIDPSGKFLYVFGGDGYNADNQGSS